MSLFAASSQAQTIISTYVSAPNATSSGLSNTTVETFDSLATGNRTSNYSSAIGTYQLTATNPFNVQADNSFGSGTGNYVSIGSQSGTTTPYTLQFASAQNYFGLSLNALDNNNGFSFYSGSAFIGRFSSAAITSLFANTTVTSINSTVYNSSSYRGKPGSSGATNGGENYVFLHLFSSGGTFDRIVFDNSSSTSTGFETDNHTIITTGNPPPTPQGTFVFVQQVVVPEPAPLALLLPALGVFLARRRRK